MRSGSPIELFALRKLTKRPASDAELESTGPLYQKGEGERGAIGLLFIHGFTVTPANFRGYAERLAQAGYTVSIPLLPGHGQRPEALLDVTWHQWLDAVLEAHDRLRQDCERVVVLGISLGGALALQLATRRDGIERLFLLAPALYPIPLLNLAIRTLIPLLKRLGVRFWVHVAGDVKDPEGFELGYGKTAISGLEQLHACMLATQQILPWVSTETTIFQGRVDHEVPADRVTDLVMRLGSSRKELIWLEDSFHEIPRDNDSERVFTKIRDELEALVGG